MKKHLSLLVLLTGSMLIHSQSYDLIVKNNGDSIACNIDSIGQGKIYFKMKNDYAWMHTYMPLTEVFEYSYDAVPKKTAIFKSGSSYLKPHVEEIETGGKNVMYGTLGLLGVWGVADINYERMILHRGDKFFSSLWFRFGGGVWVAWEDTGFLAVTGFTMLGGKGNSHLEMNAGITGLYDTWYTSAEPDFDGEGPFLSDYIRVMPAGGIGYRFQKSEGHFVFRTGLSYPESFYFSFGVKF